MGGTVLRLIRRAFLVCCGLLLIPLCLIVTWAVVSLLQSMQPSSYSAVSVSVIALVGGFAAWVTAYFALPRPVRSYVIAHELTHALWGYLTGANVFRMRLSRTSGSVVVSKNNVLITLAPYFFPLYTVIIILAYCIVSLFHDMGRYELAWLALVGFSWGFHVTFTVSTLLQHQSDVREYGRLFSYALICLLNVIGVGLWIVAVSSATLGQFWRLAVGHAAALWRLAERLL